jgi:hypothetical protein
MKIKPKPKRITAAYRARLGCQIVKKACEGEGIPPNVPRYDWMWYNLFCVLDDLATAIEEGRKP